MLQVNARVSSEDGVEKLTDPDSNGDCFGHSRFEQLGKLLGRYRAAEIISLRFITLVSPEKCQLFLSFHAFSNDPQSHASAHTDNRTHNSDIAGSHCDLTDKGLVDFNGIDWKFPQITQAGITSPKIIDGNLDPVRSEGLENGCSGLSSFH